MRELATGPARVVVPDGAEFAAALSRTTHLAIGAHADDVVLMAYPGILDCFGRDDRWFSAVTVTHGGSSPRGGPYADVSDDELKEVRASEELKAAIVGEYAAAVLLGLDSTAVVDDRTLIESLRCLLEATQPDVVYTHSLADRHATHVGVAMRTLEAIRSLRSCDRPKRVYGCEVWGDLDWLTGPDRVEFDVSARPSLGAALIGVYDSQLTGAKRYDVAIEGRRAAHATFGDSAAVDGALGVTLAMDLTPLTRSERFDAARFARAQVDRFATSVADRIDRMQPPRRELLGQVAAGRDTVDRRPHLVVVPDAIAVARAVADIVEAQVCAATPCRIGLATGGTMAGPYDELARRHEAGRVTFADVDAFVLDEYIGLPVDSPRRYRSELLAALGSRVGLAENRLHGPDVDANELLSAARDYEQFVAEAGVDLQLLGIGANGHVGFNEPGSSFDSLTRVVELSERTRRDNARFFPSAADVPTHAITQGLATISRARHLVLVAIGAHKAEALRDAMDGAIDPALPASMLRLHDRVTVVADRAAARLLDAPS